MISNEVLLALLMTKVSRKLEEIPEPSSLKGLRGHQGPPGKDFDFSEHEETIKNWAKEFSLKFEDLSEEQIESLRGEKGPPGKDFNFSEHEDTIKNWAKEFSLKFEDLTKEEIESLRGEKGEDGKDFNFEENEAYFEEISKKFAAEFALKFENFTVEQIAELRGPKGRDGRDGKNFVFDEHLEFFESLKLSFSDLTEEEVSKLKLSFNDLSSQEKDSLKLKFDNLTEDEKMSLRGPRGQRGRQGDPGDSIKGDKGERGEKGEKGDKGDTVRGPAGPHGIRGFDGLKGADGLDGVDGQDAPFITDVKIEQTKKDFYFVFEFSDGTKIITDSLKLPQANTYVAMSAGGGSSSSGGSGGGTSLTELGSWDSPNVVTGEIGISRDLDLKYYLKSNSGAVVGSLPDGVAKQRIELVGTSNTDTLELNSSTNILASGPMVLKLGSSITFGWTPGLSKWLEVTRNEI